MSNKKSLLNSIFWTNNTVFINEKSNAVACRLILKGARCTTYAYRQPEMMTGWNLSSKKARLANKKSPGTKCSRAFKCVEKNLNFFAVRAGFEPAVQNNPYDSLANCSFRPLRHLTRSSTACWTFFLKRKGCKSKDTGFNSQIFNGRKNGSRCFVSRKDLMLTASFHAIALCCAQRNAKERRRKGLLKV